jgi:homoserine O-succinyltransferase/O-acetyltransferase
MILMFDSYRPIPSPALAPGEDEFAEPVELTIGLINNMPDTALKATERQFMGLLTAAASNLRVRFHCFSLPSVVRSEAAQWRLDTEYTDIADLTRLKFDGLIVTGAEPVAATLPEEPFWQDLTDIIDWAKTNTHSTIWSCLAAHAAVKHLDGIERHRLETKCSGIYDCARVRSDWLTADVPAPLKVSHSRLNELHESELTAHGYRVLTRSHEAGVDIFAKHFGSEKHFASEKNLGSEFVFFQGHPEYDALSLQREYLRDITRFIAGERDTYPAIPSGYFDVETEGRLVCFQKRACAERKLPLSAELPGLRLRRDVAAEAAPVEIFRNWLGYLSDRTTATLQPD